MRRTEKADEAKDEAKQSETKTDRADEKPTTTERRHRQPQSTSATCRTPEAPDVTASPRRLLQSKRRQIRRELLRQIGPPQREVHDGLQEAELVAGVVAHALDLAGVDRPRLEQLAQTVGQLDLAGPVALGRRERREDVGRQDVAADDGEVRRRLVARRLLDQIADAVDALAEIRTLGRAR